MTTDHPPQVPSHTRIRTLGVCATLSLPALWASGALGEAFSWQIAAALTVALSFVCLMIPAARLGAALKITVILASTSSALCVADTALRVFAGQLVYYRAHSELLRRDTRHPGLSHYLPSSRSDRTTFGDLAAMSGNPSHRIPRREIFETDERGFRNTTRKEPRPFDLIVVGDSFGMGLGTTQDETWTSILERQGHSLYNLSLPATCAAHGAARLALELPTLPLAQNATIVVPIYVGNDLEECSPDVAQLLAGQPASRFTSARVALEDYRSRSPLRQFGMRLVYRWLFPDPVVTPRELQDGRSILFYKPHVRAARIPAAEVEHDPNFAVVTKALRDIQTIAHHHHASMVIVILPTKEEVYGWLLRGESPDTTTRPSAGFATAIKTFCETQSIRCLDLTPQFMDAANIAFQNRKLLWWTDDSHWNQDGHEIAANLIAQAVETK